MKTLLKALCVTVLAASVAHAGDNKDEKDLKKAIENNGIYVETAQKGIVLSGYVDTSYTYGFTSAADSNSGNENRYRSFDNKGDSFNVNAFKLALEKSLGDKNDYAAGFRADLMYGTDAASLKNASGYSSNTNTNSASEFFLEQAYAQFRVPVGNGLDFKIGKFVTLLGYEVIESPANLNFSRGLLFTNVIPLTHTGVLASYKFNDNWDAQFGVVNGWNNDSATFNDGSNHGKAITGRVNYTFAGKNANIANSFIYSPQGDSNAVASYDNGNKDLWVWDMWAQWAPKFANDKLLLAVNTDFGGSSGTSEGTFQSQGDSNIYGVALYEKYQFTKVFSLAFREEYLHANQWTSEDNTNQLIAPDVWSFTATAGFNIWENLLTRLEYRYDMASGTSINGTDQHEVSVNVVYTF
jgi:hypothetical protein